MTQAANLAALGTNAGTTGILPAAGGGTAGTAGVTGFKNRFINGAMVISQYNGTSSVTPSSDGYVLDRYKYEASAASKFTFQQNAGSVTPPAGFSNYLGATVASAYSVVSNSYFILQQRIEGYNIADLNWGSANAKTVTLSFWAYSSLTGVFGGSVQNSAQNRSYPFTYTISSANTWTQISITVPGETTGTWLTTNGVGMIVYWGLGTGSLYNGTAGAWSSSNYVSAIGETNVVGTAGATFYLTGAQLEVGTAATNFDVRSIGTELALCQRYYWQRTYYYTGNAMLGTGQVYSGSNANSVWIQVTNEFRTTPTLSKYPAYGDLYLSNANSSGAPVTSSGSYAPQVSSGGVYWDLARTGGGLTAGNATNLYAPTANVTFGLSAEL
jgi:hypothetical protein